MPEELKPFGADMLHLYGQAFWHCNAYISGSRSMLTALRCAIDSALKDGASSVDAVASDGEGYTLHIVAASDDDTARQSVPYTDECAADQRPYEQRFYPWNRRAQGAPDA